MSDKKRSAFEIIFPVFVVCFIVGVWFYIAIEAIKDGSFDFEFVLVPIGFVVFVATAIIYGKHKNKKLLAKLTREEAEELSQMTPEERAREEAEDMEDSHNNISAINASEQTVCPNCGAWIAKSAQCPQCGAKLSKSSNVLLYAIITLIIMACGFFIVWRMESIVLK